MINASNFKLKINYLVILFLFLGMGDIVAQSYMYERYFPGRYQVGIQVGGANYHGDLAAEIVPDETNFMIGVYGKRNNSKFYATSLQITYGRISGTDENFENYHWRNLEFYSDIFELSWQHEVNFRPYGVNVKDNYSTPYLFTGLSVFTFNPKVKQGKSEIELRKLGTEGQNLPGGPRKYRLVQPALIMGMGYKVNVSEKVELGLKVGFRKTWTDYLDDVSGQYPDYNTLEAQNGLATADYSHREVENGFAPVRDGTMRGDPSLKDWFVFGGLTMSYRIMGRGKCPQ